MGKRENTFIENVAVEVMLSSGKLANELAAMYKKDPVTFSKYKVNYKPAIAANILDLQKYEYVTRVLKISDEKKKEDICILIIRAIYKGTLNIDDSLIDEGVQFQPSIMTAGETEINLVRLYKYQAQYLEEPFSNLRDRGMEHLDGLLNKALKPLNAGASEQDLAVKKLNLMHYLGTIINTLEAVATYEKNKPDYSKKHYAWLLSSAQNLFATGQDFTVDRVFDIDCTYESLISLLKTEEETSEVGSPLEAINNTLPSSIEKALDDARKNADKIKDTKKKDIEAQLENSFRGKRIYDLKMAYLYNHLDIDPGQIMFHANLTNRDVKDIVDRVIIEWEAMTDAMYPEENKDDLFYEDLEYIFGDVVDMSLIVAMNKVREQNYNWALKQGKEARKFKEDKKFKKASSEAYEKTIKELKEENRRLEAENKRHASKHEQIKKEAKESLKELQSNLVLEGKEIKKLKEALLEEQEKRKAMEELLDAIENEVVESTDELSEENFKETIKNKRILVWGAFQRMETLLQDYPEIECMVTDRTGRLRTPEMPLLHKLDMAIIALDFTSHPTYYKVRKLFKDAGVPLAYITKGETNVKRYKKTIYDKAVEISKKGEL